MQYQKELASSRANINSDKERKEKKCLKEKYLKET